MHAHHSTSPLAGLRHEDLVSMLRTRFDVTADVVDVDPFTTQMVERVPA